MPKNLRDFMNRNNITSSSRESQDDARKRALGSGTSEPFSKFPKSREECTEEMSSILMELDKKDADLKKAAEGHNMGLIKKFNEDYDNLANQIIRYVEVRLKENKQKLLREIKQRRNVEMAECKPIARNIEQIRSEVTSLRDGLYRSNQYRQYMSQIMIKDFEADLRGIQYDIDRIRFPSLDVRLDDKYNTCFKSDLEKLIIVRDELSSRMGSNFAPEDINSHTNRDEIKRTKTANFR